ncbi:MAG: tyrosine-type recombinase/integrase [Gorillibacterium sp.]|nr:tyrosine-type recombinase/integrase [Gorillibacterium sp.]
MGNRIKPNYISQNFSDTLKKYGMRHIRFHDLRHSCATLLLTNGVNMKEVQERLGSQ